MGPVGRKESDMCLLDTEIQDSFKSGVSQTLFQLQMAYKLA